MNNKKNEIEYGVEYGNRIREDKDFKAIKAELMHEFRIPFPETENDGKRFYLVLSDIETYGKAIQRLSGICMRVIFESEIESVKLTDITRLNNHIEKAFMSNGLTVHAMYFTTRVYNDYYGSNESYVRYNIELK